MNGEKWGGRVEPPGVQTPRFSTAAASYPRRGPGYPQRSGGTAPHLGVGRMYGGRYGGVESDVESSVDGNVKEVLPDGPDLSL